MRNESSHGGFGRRRGGGEEAAEEFGVWRGWGMDGDVLSGGQLGMENRHEAKMVGFERTVHFGGDSVELSLGLSGQS